MITGDALVTVNLNSLWGFLLWGVRRNKQILSGPPWYTTWSWRAAKESVAAVARVEPRVLATGHGLPMTGPTTARDVRAFAEHDGKLTEGWTDFARKGGNLIGIMGIGVGHLGEAAPDGVSAITIL